MEIDKAVVERLGSDYFSGNDYEFYRRVWEAGPESYRNRLINLGFTGLGRVLDAGCGFGQWSMQLVQMNNSVSAFDVSAGRVNALREIAEFHGVRNLNCSVQSLEKTNYPDSYFDAVFCYSVIFMTDVKAALRELCRVLKKGGALYVTTNGLGWYLHNLIDGHNSSASFDSRQMAVDAISNSLRYYSGEGESEGTLITPKSVMLHWITEAGFENALIGGDGRISVNEGSGVESKVFYEEMSYHGEEGVYEIYARKA